MKGIDTATMKRSEITPILLQEAMKLEQEEGRYQVKTKFKRPGANFQGNYFDHNHIFQDKHQPVSSTECPKKSGVVHLNTLAFKVFNEIIPDGIITCLILSIQLFNPACISLSKFE